MSEGITETAASVRAEFEKWDGHPSPRRHFATAFVDVDALCQHVVELRAQLRDRLPLATPEMVACVGAAREARSLIDEAMGDTDPDDDDDPLLRACQTLSNALHNLDAARAARPEGQNDA